MYSPEHIKELVELRQQNEELRLEVKRLRYQLQLGSLRLAGKSGVTRQQEILLKNLLKYHPNVVPRSKLHAAISFKEGTDPKMVDVQVSRIRRKFGIPIVCIWNDGYYIPPHAVDRVREMFKLESSDQLEAA